MRILIEPLWKFIHDYQLRHIDCKVCFNGMVYFNVNNRFKKIQSEVHIIFNKTLNHDTIYLLNPMLPVFELPSLFQTTDIVTYLPKQCLIITGTSIEYGTYIVSIFVENNNCNTETISELRGKRWN